MPQQTVEDLGKLVKQKYPKVYDGMSDAELGAKVKSKYPSYSQFADKPTDKWASFGQGVADYAKGALKGGLSTLTHLGEIGIDLQGDPNTAEGRMFNKVQQSGKDVTEQVRTPRNENQSRGFALEQGAEYFIPGVDEVIPEARVGAGLARRFGTMAVKDAVRAGTVGTAQTGSVKEGAKQAAFAGTVGPAVNELARAASPILKKSAQHLYERFITPGGGTKFNKQVAGEAAAEMIKQGHFEWTKGNFSRHVETNLQDADKQIEHIEDTLLDRLGYSPTGRYGVHAEQEPYVHQTGPVIDVDPVEHSTALTKTTREVGMPERGVGPTRTVDEGSAETRYRTKYSSTAETRQGLIDGRKVLANLAKMQGEDYVNGSPVEGYRQIVKTRRMLMSQIHDNMTPNGMIDARTAIKLRRKWDRLVNWEKPEGSRMSPGVRDAFQNAANAFRHEIGEQIDGMKEANAKYHFYASLNQVIKDVEDRRVGHTSGGLVGNTVAAATGTGTFLFTHNPEEAAGLAMLVWLTKHGIGSGANLTGSAIVLDRAANLIRNHKFAAAVNRLATVASPVVRTGKPETQDHSDDYR